MTEQRHTASSITDKQLDALYARLDAEEEVSRRLLAQRQEMAEERYAWQERGDRAEAAIERVRAECARLNGETRGLNPYALAGRRDAVARVLAALDTQE